MGPELTHSAGSGVLFVFNGSSQAGGQGDGWVSSGQMHVLCSVPDGLQCWLCGLPPGCLVYVGLAGVCGSPHTGVGVGGEERPDHTLRCPGLQCSSIHNWPSPGSWPHLTIFLSVSLKNIHHFHGKHFISRESRKPVALNQREKVKWKYQSCLTLCDPMDCSPPGSSVHGILQARMPEWVVMPSSRGSS